MTEMQRTDPVIVDAVEHVSYRFGVQGLRDLITLATEELGKAEAALQELSNLDG
jgi:hypothetical protein